MVFKFKTRKNCMVVKQIDQTNFRAMQTDWLNLELDKQNKSVDN